MNDVIRNNICGRRNHSTKGNTMVRLRRLRFSLFLSFFFLWLGIVLSAYGAADTGPSHELVILHTNDTHGHPAPFPYKKALEAGGLPARAALIRAIRKEHSNVLLLDAGDLNTGRAESGLFYGRPDIEGYNALGYDAMVLGNHEFDHPRDVLLWQMGLAEFPFLGANISLSGGRPFTAPYIIKSFGGFKVAIMGLITRNTMGIVNPEHIKDLIFEDEVAVARRLVPKMKERADIVIALTHLGIYDTAKRGSKRLAREVKGIDLIVDGHSHTYLKNPIVIRHRASDHSTPIVQAWKWGLVLGRVDLRVRKKSVIDLSFRAIPINLDEPPAQTEKNVSRSRNNRVPQDPDLLSLIRPYMDQASSILSREVGVAEEAFSHEGIRSQETSLGRLVADSMAWCTGEDRVDFAIQNGGGIRTGIRKGPITMANLYEAIPFMNTVQVLTLRGKDVKALFDYMARISQGSGAFPQVSSGLMARMDPQRKSWEMIKIQGRPFDRRRTYKIATNSYLAKGGDGYKVFLKAASVFDTSISQREALMKYIEAKGGRIRPVMNRRLQIGQSYPFDHPVDSRMVSTRSIRGMRAESSKVLKSP